MLIKSKVIFFLIVFTFFLKQNCLAQDPKDSLEVTFPKSIYTPTLYFSVLNYNISINEKLNLKGLKFVILDKKDIEEGFFTFLPDNLSRIPTKYIFEDYKEAYLSRQIFKGYDLRKLPWITSGNK